MSVRIPLHLQPEDNRPESAHMRLQLYEQMMMMNPKGFRQRPSSKHKIKLLHAQHSGLDMRIAGLIMQARYGNAERTTLGLKAWLKRIARGLVP